MLTGGFDFQRGMSYSYSLVTIALKGTVFELGAMDRHAVGRTDGRTDRRIAALLPAPTAEQGILIAS